jgi:hypothetical protein
VDVGDPRFFLSAVIELFMEFPVEVMEAVSDPVRGLPSRVKRPDLVDIRRACEEAYEPIRRKRERDEIAEQRRRALPQPERAPRLTREEIDAKLAEKWPGMFRRKDAPNDRRARGFRPLAEIAAEYGMTEAQIKALPDAPSVPHE